MANKAGLIDRIKERLAGNMQTKHIHEKATIGHVLDALGAEVATILAEGGKVTLPGLGTLELVERKARKGRNPRTGVPIDIEASRSAKFNVGKALKDALNSVS